MKNFFRKWWPQIIVIIASFGVLLLFKDQMIIAGGDSILDLDYTNWFGPLSSAWNDKVNLGSANSSLARFFPTVVFWKFFSLLHVPTWLIQRCWILALSSSSGLSVFYLVVNLFQKRTVSIKIGAIVASILYLYNMFVVTDPTQVNLHLILAILPWLLLLWMKGLNKKKFDFTFSLWIGIISLLIAASATNIASISVVPIILGIYFLHHIATKPKTFKRSLLFALATIANCIIFNLWWISTSILFMLKTSHETAAVSAEVSFIDSAKVIDALRLLGSWAFETSYNSIPLFGYSNLFTTGILVLTTLLITIFIFLTFLKKYLLRSTLFFLLLSIVGIFLVKGSNPPWGELYSFLHSKPVFWIFREPFSKFTPITLLAFSVLIGLAMTMLLSKIKKMSINKKVLVSFVTVAIVICLLLVNAFPLLTGQAIWDKENGSMRSLHTKVPDYWQEADNWLSENDPKSQVLLLPKAGYGQAYNWEHGFGGASYVAMVVLSNSTVGYPAHPVSKTDKALIEVYDLLDSDKLGHFAKALSVLNVKYILQQNDLNWQQGLLFKSPSPSVMKSKLGQIDGIKPVKSFGQLDLYQLDDKFLSETIELNSHITYTDGNIADIFKEVTFRDGQLVENFYLASQLEEDEKEIISQKATNLVLNIKQDEDKKEKYFELPTSGSYEIFLANLNTDVDSEKIIINGKEVLLHREELPEQNKKTKKQLTDLELIDPKSCEGDDSKALLRFSIPPELSLANNALEGFFIDNEKIEPIAIDTKRHTVDICSEVKVSKAENAKPWQKWRPVDTQAGQDMYSTALDDSFTSDLTTSIDDKKLIVSFLGDRETREEFENSLTEPYSLNIGSVKPREVILVTPQGSDPPDDLSVYYIKKDDLSKLESFSIRTEASSQYLKTSEKISINKSRNSISLIGNSGLDTAANIILSSNQFDNSISIADMTYKKISATKYEAKIPKTDTDTTLLFKNTFDEKWEAQIDGSSLNNHIIANGFENSWQIGKGQEGIITISYAPQRTLIIALIISAAYLAFSILYLWRKKRKLELARVNLEIDLAYEKPISAKFSIIIETIISIGFSVFVVLILLSVILRLIQNRDISDWLGVQAFVVLIVILIVKLFTVGKKLQAHSTIVERAMKTAVVWIFQKTCSLGIEFYHFMIKHWPLIIIAILGLASQIWFRDNLIIASGDNYQYLDPGKLFDDNILTVYVKSNAGYANPAINTVFPFMFFWKVLEALHFSLITIQRLWCYLNFTVAGFTMYALIFYLFRNEKYNKIAGLTGALLYMANAYIQLDVFQITAKPLHAVFPLIFLLWIKGLHYSKKKALYYAFSLSLTSIFIVSSGANIALIGAPLLILLAYTIYFFITTRKKIISGLKFIGLSLISLIVVNLWWLIVTIPAMIVLNQNTPEKIKDVTFEDRTHIIDAFRLLGAWGFRIKMDLGNGNFVPNVPYAEGYYQLPLLIITFGIPIIAFLVFILKKDKLRVVIFLGILALIGLFLIKGTNPPLGGIYYIIRQKIPMFWVFREPFTKFILVYLFPLSILFGLSIQCITNFVREKFSKTNKPWVKKIYFAVPILAIIAIIFSAHPLFTGQNVPDHTWYNTPRYSSRVKVPKYWKELETWFDKNDPNGRVALFPKASYGHTYRWGSGMPTGNYVAEVLISNPLLRYPTLISLNISDMFVSELYTKLNEQNFDGFNKLMDLLNAKYVLQQDDLAWDHALEDTPSPAIMHNFLNRNKDIEMVKNFSKLTLYRIKGADKKNIAEVAKEIKLIPAPANKEDIPNAIINEYNPNTAILIKGINNDGKEDKVEGTLAELSNTKSSSIKVIKLSPTRYQINVKGKNKFFLTFKMTFLEDWKAYVLSENQKFSPLNKKGKISEDLHFVTNGYANGWIVTPPGCVVDEKCGDSYNVIIDYNPQNVLYLGLIISGSALACFVVYLIIFPFFKGKKNRKISEPYEDSSRQSTM